MDIKKNIKTSIATVHNFIRAIGAWLLFIFITELIFLFLINLMILIPTKELLVLGLVIVSLLAYPTAIFSLSLSFYVLFPKDWRTKVDNKKIFIALVGHPFVVLFFTPFIFQYFMERTDTAFFNVLFGGVLVVNMFFLILQTQFFPPFDLARFIYRGFDGIANKYIGTISEEEFLSFATVLNANNTPHIKDTNGKRVCFVSSVENFLRSKYTPLVHLSFEKDTNTLTANTMNYSGFHAVPERLNYFEPVFKKLGLANKGTEKFSDDVFYIDREHPKLGKSTIFFLFLIFFNGISFYLARNYIITRKLLPGGVYSIWISANNVIRQYPLISIIIALVIGYIVRDLPKTSEIINRALDKLKKA